MDAITPKGTRGPLPASRKVHEKGARSPDIRLPPRPVGLRPRAGATVSPGGPVPKAGVITPEMAFAAIREKIERDGEPFGAASPDHVMPASMRDEIRQQGPRRMGEERRAGGPLSMSPEALQRLAGK